MINLSTHPTDYFIHLSGYAVAVAAGTPWWIAFIFGLCIEYEQKSQVWYDKLTWKEYITKHSLGDVIANCVGIIIGLLI